MKKLRAILFSISIFPILIGLSQSAFALNASMLVLLGDKKSTIAAIRHKDQIASHIFANTSVLSQGLSAVSKILDPEIFPTVSAGYILDGSAGYGGTVEIGEAKGPTEQCGSMLGRRTYISAGLTVGPSVGVDAAPGLSFWRGELDSVAGSLTGFTFSGSAGFGAGFTYWYDDSTFSGFSVHGQVGTSVEAEAQQATTIWLGDLTCDDREDFRKTDDLLSDLGAWCNLFLFPVKPLYCAITN